MRFNTCPPFFSHLFSVEGVHLLDCHHVGKLRFIGVVCRCDATGGASMAMTSAFGVGIMDEGVDGPGDVVLASRF
jgi:hypothetical protein